MGQQDSLQGFLPYLIPVFFGYVFALDVKSHWSDNRLKNDIMAYVGSTLLVGYPLLISLSLWFAGAEVDPTTSKIRVVTAALFFVNLLIAAFVCRGAVTRGFPLSLPWGGVSGGKDTEVAKPDEPVESPSEVVVTPEQSSEALPQMEQVSETREETGAEESQSEADTESNRPKVQ